MVKKTRIKDIDDLRYQINKKGNEILNKLIPTVHFFSERKYMKEGTLFFDYTCEQCGHIQTNTKELSHNEAIECPNCKAKGIFNANYSYRETRGFDRILFIENEILVIIKFDVYYNTQYQSGKMVRHNSIYETFYFSKDTGTKIFNQNGNISKKNRDYDYNYDNFIRFNNLLIDDEEFLYSKFMVKSLDELKTIIKEKDAEIDAKGKTLKDKRKETTNEILKDISMHKFKDINIDKNALFISLYDDSQENETNNCVCSFCGESFLHEFEKNVSNNVICPSCKYNFLYKNIMTTYNESSEKKYDLSILEIANGLLVARMFNLTINYQYGNITKELLEYGRIVFLKKKMIYIKFNSVCQTWEIVNGQDFSGYKNSVLVNLEEQSMEKIKECLQNSVLRYSGIELCMSEAKKISLGESSYIKKWYKYPVIEKFLKIGMSNIVDDIRNATFTEIKEKLNMKETELHKVIGVSKSAFKSIHKNNFSLSEIIQFKSFLHVDSKLDGNVFLDIKSKVPYASNKVINIASKYNISFERILEYMLNCFDFQCIKYSETISIWYDYLKMAREIGYDLRSNSKNFPSSLKKEHDKALFVSNTLKKEIDVRKFTEKYEANKKYEYSFEDLMVVIPKESMEVIREGDDLNHCVAIYVDRIINGETTIVFIRKKDKPDESYYTIEINNNCITQVKGMCNCAPDKKVLFFVNKFATYKKLKVHF